MKKNKTILLLVTIFLSIGFFVVLSKLASAETCEGNCRLKSCLSGEEPTGQEGVCTGDYVCCKPVGGGGGGGSSTTMTFPNPIGVEDVETFLNSFLAKMRGVVATIAVVFIVLGGIFYMLSAGNEKMVTRAKLCWTGAIIGLAIVLAAPSFLTEIVGILGGSNIKYPQGPSLYDIGVRVLKLLLSVFGIIAMISLISGGGMYLTAYGDEDRIKTARKIISFSVLGIVIGLSAVIIINQISYIIEGM